MGDFTPALLLTLKRNMELNGFGQTQKISDPARLSTPDQTFSDRDTPCLQRLIQKKEIWQMKKHMKSKLEIPL